MTQQPRTPTTGLTVAEKSEIARMALDEDTAVSLVEWIERDRADLLAQIEKAVRDEEWWTDDAMVNGGIPGDEHFIADAASPDDAARLAKAHNAILAAIRSAAPVEPTP